MRSPASSSLVMILIMVAVFLVTIVVDRSRLGFGLRCIQQNEDAANMVGVNTTRYKVIAYTLSALFCGTVGAAYASWTGYIDPSDSFSIIMTIKVPVMCLLGGPGTVLGPVVGTAVFTLLEEVFWANFLDYNRAILGAVIVVLIFFLPGGLLALSYRDVVGAPCKADPPAEGRGMSATILVADRLSQHFGGIHAVDDLSFALKEGEIVALIGPNGAGKTTLVNLMTGVHRPSSGRIRFQGEDVTGAASVRGGAARHRPHLPDRPAVPAHDRAGERRGRRAVRRRAAERAPPRWTSRASSSNLMGLAQFADRPASALTLAGRKRLELAKSMAMRPKVLMLDEVNAGLNASEIDGALRLIRQIAERGVTILIIEHLMKVVMSLAAARAGAASRPAHRRRQRRRDRAQSAGDRSLSRREIRPPRHRGGGRWLSRC